MKNFTLKAEIVRNGLTLEMLSKMTQIPRSYISMAIQGRLNLNSQEKARISNVLGVSESEIFESRREACHG